LRGEGSAAAQNAKGPDDRENKLFRMLSPLWQRPWNRSQPAVVSPAVQDDEGLIAVRSGPLEKMKRR
jgi:hypothetical protein